MEYFGKILKGASLFKDESKFDISFIPDNFIHREKELSMLTQLFSVLLINPNSMSRKILIMGKSGIGKTLTVRFFEETLKKAADEKKVPFEYIHINCRKERTIQQVLVKIIGMFPRNFFRGKFSTQDLIKKFKEILILQNLHLLVVLDELSFVINKDEDLIKVLNQINENSVDNKQRISIIGITRDIKELNNFNKSTLSILKNNVIEFSTYSKAQIFDILKYRAGLCLKNNIISDKLIEMISDFTYKSEEIRERFSILWRATKIAEGKNLKYITSECIRLGSGSDQVIPSQNIENHIECEEQELDHSEQSLEEFNEQYSQHYIEMYLEKRRKEGIDDELFDELERQYWSYDEVDPDSFDKEMKKQLKHDLRFYVEMTTDIEINEIFREQNNFTNFTDNYVKINSISTPGIVEIKGFIDKDLNGIILYEVCKNCLKKADDCTCDKAKALEFIVIINIFIEDGTGAIRTVFIGDLAEELIKKSSKNVLMIKEQHDYEKFLGKLSSGLLKGDIIIKGRAKFNIYSQKYEIVVYNFKFTNIDEELERAIRKIES